MITNFYIDGFNLYYRAVRNTEFKWLNLRKLAEILFPKTPFNRFVISLPSSIHEPTIPPDDADS